MCTDEDFLKTRELGFAKRLDELLKNKSAASRLARALSVHRATVSAWRRGRSLPGLEMLAQIVNELGVSADSLIGVTDDPTAPSGAHNVS